MKDFFTSLTKVILSDYYPNNINIIFQKTKFIFTIKIHLNHNKLCYVRQMLPVSTKNMSHPSGGMAHHVVQDFKQSTLDKYPEFCSRFLFTSLSRAGMGYSNLSASHESSTATLLKCLLSWIMLRVEFENAEKIISSEGKTPFFVHQTSGLRL